LDKEQRQDAYNKYQLIEPYLNGTLKLNDIAKNKQIPIRTLNLWLKKYRQNRLLGVLRKCNSELVQSIEGLYLKNPTLSIRNIYVLVQKYCFLNNLKLPSYRTVCRIIDNISDDIVLLNAKGSKVYKQSYDFLHRWSASYANEIWQADHILIDIEIATDAGTPQRPWLTVIIDDYSRGICGYELSFLSPSAQKTSLCLRHAIWRKSDPNWIIFGIPETLYTDHGSDFTSEHIDQVCIDLKIKLIHSTVGCPRGRRKIERFFRTLNQKLISITTAISDKKTLALKQLNEITYNYIIQYNHSVHSQIHKSPVQQWQNNGFIPQIVDSLESLDLLLLTEIKPRKVQRDGIKFQGLRYINVMLAEYVGESVVIRYTPSDITSIRIYYKDKFLCQAICSELANESISIKEIQKARNKRRQELKQAINHRKSLVDAFT
ncbi:Transposase for transposon Tn552, partial [Pseudolycoriella hygida]